MERRTQLRELQEIVEAKKGTAGSHDGEGIWWRQAGPSYGQ